MLMYADVCCRYEPAWLLHNETLERESRLKNARATSQTRAEKTAVLVVGNEIMSGSIRDENGHFLLAELRKLGLHTEVLSICSIYLLYWYKSTNSDGALAAGAGDDTR